MTETNSTQTGTDSRPEYVDFDPHDFPGGVTACLEAILMSSEEPQKAEDLARILTLDSTEVEQALQELATQYSTQQRGFDLAHSVRGWRFVSAAAFEPVVAAAINDKQSNRLSQASLEALAIIAYQQPITRGQVGSIRGVTSDGVVRSLLMRGLVEESGEDPETHARLLATTDLFLEKIGLPSLDNLPALAPFLPNREEALEAEPPGARDAPEIRFDEDLTDVEE